MIQSKRSKEERASSILKRKKTQINAAATYETQQSYRTILSPNQKDCNDIHKSEQAEIQH